MSTGTRGEYRLILPGPAARDGQTPVSGIRTARPGDADALADLMLDAYRGTADDEGGTIDDARGEIRSFLEGAYGAPDFDSSFVCEDEGALSAAVLTSWWTERGAHLICFLMTRAGSKRRGLGSALLSHAVTAMQSSGAAEVRAVITRGNTPSEQLFKRAGFKEVE